MLKLNQFDIKSLPKSSLKMVVVLLFIVYDIVFFSLSIVISKEGMIYNEIFLILYVRDVLSCFHNILNI